MSGIMDKAKAGCRHAGQIIPFLRGPRGPLDLGTAMALSNAGLQLIREMNAAGVQQVSWRFDDDMSASARLDAAERLNRSFQELQAAAHRHAPDRTPRRQAIDALPIDAPLADAFPEDAAPDDDGDAA